MIALIGTNASGKSSLGVELAQELKGEVISADSRQVYKELNLGSGKLRPEEMGGVPHHLIDVASLAQNYSLADFQRDAYAAIDSIETRGCQPLMVGGTGLYVDAVTEGYVLPAAPPDPERRRSLLQEDPEDLVARIELLDPRVLTAVGHRDRRRLVRAIERLEAGVPFAEWDIRQPRYEVLKLGLTWPAPILHERIRARLERRLEEGMIREVQDLLEQGIARERLDGLGLEYRFIVRYIDGVYPSEAAFVDDLERAIRRFARRQLAWYRRDSTVHWLDAETASKDALEMAVGFLDGRGEQA